MHPHTACSISLCVRGAMVTRAHLNDTSYRAFVGIQETPWRIPGFCLSTAYHTWLGRISRSQTLSESLQLNLTLSVSGRLGTCLLCSLFATICFLIFMLFFFLQIFPFSVHTTGCYCGQFCLYCSASCQQSLNELATPLAMPFLIYFLLKCFSFNFPHKWFWFSLQRMGFEMSVFLLLYICHIFSQKQWLP